MNTFLFFNETFSNGYIGKSLILIDIICIIAAISVIVSKNPIVSVLFLIGLFLTVACHLLVSGLNFIGLSYLLVYVGAVSILFLFILMLINIRISELLNHTSNVIPLALIIGLSFNYPVYEILSYANYNSFYNNVIGQYYNNNILNDFLKYGHQTGADKTFFVSSKLWDGSLAETTHIASIGNIMYTSYSIWLLLTSIILLLAMVGAIVITIKQPNN